LSGPATPCILEREYHEYGKPEYARLAGISVSHLCPRSACPPGMCPYPVCFLSTAPFLPSTSALSWLRFGRDCVNCTSSLLKRRLTPSLMNSEP